MHDCKIISTPIAKWTNLGKNDCPSDNQTKLVVPYAQVVGSLMYLMMCTRPDIRFPIDLVSRYQSNPGWPHWQAVKRIFRYLKGTKGLKLTFQADDLSLQGYSDVDFVGCKDDNKSTSGYVFLFGGGALAWSYKKQSCVAQHTQEAEYIGCNVATTFAVWINRFIKDLNIGLNFEPIQIYCDNKVVISLMKNGAVSCKETIIF